MILDDHSVIIYEPLGKIICLPIQAAAEQVVKGAVIDVSSRGESRTG